MNVLHVITSLRTGGAEKLMVDLLPRLRNLGENVELCVFDGVDTPFKKQLEAIGIKIHILRVGGSVYDIRNIFALTSLIEQFDIVHSHNTACQLFVAIAREICGKKVRLFTTEHCTTNRRRNKKYLKWIDVWMYRRYEKIICISNQTYYNLKTYLNEDSNKFVTIYNGIDTEQYIKAVPCNNCADLFEGRFKIMMVSAFRWEKDQKTLIRVMQFLSDDYHLYLVGGGSETLIAECKYLMNRLGLCHRVHFLGIRQDIPSLLKSVDVYVQSSHVEAFGLAAVEAMATGLPTIVTDVAGLTEVVGDAGIRVQVGDAEKMAQMIMSLCENNFFHSVISSKCQQRAMSFDINEMAKNYYYLYFQNS